MDVGVSQSQFTACVKIWTINIVISINFEYKIEIQNYFWQYF